MAFEEENAQLEAEIAALRAELSAPEQPSYGLKQLAFDVPVGVTRGVAGLADILAYPFAKGLQYAGAPVETFGASKLLDALIESDKGLPGKGVAEILGVRPTTEVQQAVEFMTPTPGGKGKLLQEAGLGLAAYLGSEAGQAISESPYGAVTGAVLAPLSLQAALKTAAKTGAVLAPGVNVLRGEEGTLRNIAEQEVKQALGEEGLRRLAVAQQTPELLTGAGGIPLTAAEIAQTPSMAKYQQGIKRSPGGENILEAAIAERGAEIKAAIEQLAPTTQEGELAALIRGAANEAALTKQAQDAAILDKLNIAPEIKTATSMELGGSLVAGLQQQKREAKRLVDVAWQKVPKKTKVDAAYALTQAQRDFLSFERLEKTGLSATGKQVINEVGNLLATYDGRIRVGQLQALRSAAGAALKEASGKNPREVKLMNTLREDLDLIGVEQIVTKNADAPKTAIEKWKEAITARREYGQKFEQGVTGELLKVRRLEPVVKASQAIDRILKTPENITEILGKFGKQSDESVILRSEMLSRLEKQKNPTEFIGKYKDSLKQLFDDDYKTVVSYAQQKGQKAALSEYATITDASIPNKIFADEASTANFVNQFKGTPIIDYAKGKFVTKRIIQRGDPLQNLANNTLIARQLFGDDLPKLEKVLQDLQLSKSPEQLEKLAVGRNSITAVAQTALGAIQNGRAAISLLRTGKLTAPLTGAITGVQGAIAGDAVAGITQTLLGIKLGAWADDLAKTRELQINKFAAELLSNPKLINLASAPPTQQNIDQLMQLGARLGYFAVVGAKERAMTAPTTAQSTGVDYELENIALENEIKALKTQLQPSQQVKVGKQNISIPSGEAYAPADLVKAVIQVESAGKPDAVSSKGARGLMQLMPATAKQLGVDPSDPTENVEGGSRFLQQQIKAFGSQELALAAYNWGPANVRRAIDKIRADGKNPTWELVKQYVKVPLETRQYVDKVSSLI